MWSVDRETARKTHMDLAESQNRKEKAVQEQDINTQNIL